MIAQSIRISPRYLPTVAARFTLITLLLFLGATIPAQSQRERVLHDFVQSGGAEGRLISDKQGNLYGVTHGSVKDFGTVFELERDQAGG